MLKTATTAALMLGAALLAAPAFAQDQTPENAAMSAPVVGAEGKPIGTAEMTDTPNGVLVRLTLKADAIPAGAHAMHFHEKGTCEDFADGFKASGGHYNPAEKEHGALSEKGMHAGDMPNFTVADGKETSVETLNTIVRFKDGDAPLLDADGSALIVHAKADDYKTQPTGAAGDRLGCVAITGGGG